MTAFGLPMWICLIYLFVLGTVVGSFLNVCIYRIPTKEGFWDSLRAIVYPPSRCPSCMHRIPGVFNIPLLGWLMLRGRCYHCKNHISVRYPLIECFNGLLWMLLYWLHVPEGFDSTILQSWGHGPLGPDGIAAHAPGWYASQVTLLHWQFVYHLVLIEALLVASFIDIDLRIIPDGSTLPAMAVGVAASALGYLHLTPVWHQNTAMKNELTWVFPELPVWLFPAQEVPRWIIEWPHLHGLAASLAGFVVAGGMTWILRIVGQWGLKREAMGFGDVILMALIGSFLGWQASVMVFFLAPVIALVGTALMLPFHRDRMIPYGPYLSLAALVVLMCWQPLWKNYERVFGAGPLLPVTAVVMLVLFAVISRGMQLVKQMLGWVDPVEVFDEWNSADQLAYQAGENVDPHAGRWPAPPTWPGADSARGRSQYDAWRHGGAPGANSNWMRHKPPGG